MTVWHCVARACTAHVSVCHLLLCTLAACAARHLAGASLSMPLVMVACHAASGTAATLALAVYVDATQRVYARHAEANVWDFVEQACTTDTYIVRTVALVGTVLHTPRHHGIMWHIVRTLVTHVLVNALVVLMMIRRRNIHHWL